jgi:hypothetical protein
MMKKNRIFYAITFLVACVIPVTLLTSCAKATQYFLPVSVGGNGSASV